MKDDHTDILKINVPEDEEQRYINWANDKNRRFKYAKSITNWMFGMLALFIVSLVLLIFLQRLP